MVFEESAHTPLSGDKKLFCFGYGYTANHFAGYFMQNGWRVGGTTRNPEKRDLLREHGIEAYLFDFDVPLPDLRHILRDVTHILISTPPDADGDPVCSIHGYEMGELGGFEWIGYLSATSVYGDRGGEWVTESSELMPSSRRGSRRVQAERQWLELYQRYGLPVQIFRLAGVYGPGRNALDSVRSGTARRIDKPGQAFSRIHIDDIVQTLVASMHYPNPGAIYNLSDNEPVPSHEVIAYACELLGMEPPPLIPFEQADMAPIARSFYADNKRVSNQRIKDELGVQLLHPSFRSGLESCLRVEREEGMVPEEIIY